MVVGGHTSAVEEMEPNFSHEGDASASNKLHFPTLVLRIEVIARDDAPGHNGQSSGNAVPPFLRVRLIDINPAVLAAQSPFFLKLFSNNMKESDEGCDLTLRVTDKEEVALLEVLSFMNNGMLTTTEPTLLLDILMVANKFHVESCMRHCAEMLTGFAASTESALHCLHLPCAKQPALQPLTDAATKFLVRKYKDLTMFEHELMDIPLAGIEAIFSSNDIQVASEDTIYEFLLRWARRHYPELELRREVWCSNLLQLVRFSQMSRRKLRKVLKCIDIDHGKAVEYVNEALLYKADAQHRQRALSAAAVTCQKFTERAYKYRPVRVLEFCEPFPHCLIYWDITYEECSRLFPSGRLYSQAFHLAGQGFFLSACCNMDLGVDSQCFGLFLGMQEKGLANAEVEYRFAVRLRTSGEWFTQYQANHNFVAGKEVGYRNFFGVPWERLMADDNVYFTNGLLHLRAEITMTQP